MINGWQAASERKELLMKVEATILGLLQETKHRRRITLNEIYNRISRNGTKVSRTTVQLMIREMGTIPSFEALLDRVIVN